MSSGVPIFNDLLENLPYAELSAQEKKWVNKLRGYTTFTYGRTLGSSTSQIGDFIDRVAGRGYSEEKLRFVDRLIVAERVQFQEKTPEYQFYSQAGQLEEYR